LVSPVEASNLLADELGDNQNSLLPWRGERIYSLTAEGRQAFVGAQPYWERAQERLLKVLGIADTRTLLDICERVRQAAHSAESARAKNQADLASLQTYAEVTAD
jgi:hypothetical protein